METIGYMDQKFEKLEGKTEVEGQVLWGNEGVFEEKEVVFEEKEVVLEETEIVLEETEGEWLGRGVELWDMGVIGRGSFLFLYSKSHLNPPL